MNTEPLMLRSITGVVAAVALMAVAHPRQGRAVQEPLPIDTVLEMPTPLSFLKPSFAPVGSLMANTVLDTRTAHRRCKAGSQIVAFCTLYVLEERFRS